MCNAPCFPRHRPGVPPSPPKPITAAQHTVSSTLRHDGVRSKSNLAGSSLSCGDEDCKPAHGVPGSHTVGASPVPPAVAAGQRESPGHSDGPRRTVFPAEARTHHPHPGGLVGREGWCNVGCFVNEGTGSGEYTRSDYRGGAAQSAHARRSTGHSGSQLARCQ